VRRGSLHESEDVRAAMSLRRAPLWDDGFFRVDRVGPTLDEPSPIAAGQMDAK
jgi:hypothetical protein